MTIIFDTNPFLRLLLNDLPKQADEVEKIITKAKGAEITIIVPQIVIFEIHFALDKYYKLKKSKIINKLELVINADYINLQDKNIFREAISLYKQYNLDLVDCFLLAKAQLENAQIFTFDKEIQKIKI